MGQNAADNMCYLIEEDEGTYKKQFSPFIKNNITPYMMEEMYKKAHAAIQECMRSLRKKLKRRDGISPKCHLPRRKIR